MPSKEQARASDRATAQRQPPQSDVQGFQPLTQDTQLGVIIQRARSAPDMLTPRDVLQMQRMCGNRAVNQIVAANRQETTTQGSAPAITPGLESTIQQARSGGQPLADDVRRPMEQAFGTDFGEVKVHEDARADELSQSLQARAFTTGHDIFFRSGEYDRDRTAGQKLLAHELTHVVQQTGSKSLGAGPMGESSRKAVSGQRITVSTRKASSQIQRAWRPAKVTDVAHLHRTKKRNKAKVATSFLGWIKPRLKPGAQLVVDDADTIPQGKTRWIKAVKIADVSKFDPQAQGPANKNPTGYIRERKVTLDIAPQAEPNKSPPVSSRPPEDRSRAEHSGEAKQAEPPEAFPTEAAREAARGGDLLRRIKEVKTASSAYDVVIELIWDWPSKLVEAACKDLMEQRLQDRTGGVHEDSVRFIFSMALNDEDALEESFWSAEFVTKVMELETPRKANEYVNKELDLQELAILLPVLKPIVVTSRQWWFLKDRVTARSSKEAKKEETGAPKESLPEAKQSEPPQGLATEQEQSMEARYTLAQSGFPNKLLPTVEKLTAGEWKSLVKYHAESKPKPYFETKWDVESFKQTLNEVPDLGSFGFGNLGGRVRNYHRFEADLLSRLDTNYAKKASGKPLTLILHAATDPAAGGTFHRDPMLTEVVKSDKTHVLMVEGKEKLNLYTGAVGDLVKDYGGGKLWQVMLAGHGMRRGMQMAKKPESGAESHEALPEGSITLDDKEQKKEAERFFKTLLKHMGGTKAPGTIIFNACKANMGPRKVRETDPEKANKTRAEKETIDEKLQKDWRKVGGLRDNYYDRPLKEAKERIARRKKLLARAGPNLVEYVQDLAEKMAKSEVDVVGVETSVPKSKLKLIEEKTGKLVLSGELTHGMEAIDYQPPRGPLLRRIQKANSTQSAFEAATELLFATDSQSIQAKGKAYMKQRLSRGTGGWRGDCIGYIYSLALVDEDALRDIWWNESVLEDVKRLNTGQSAVDYVEELNSDDVQTLARVLKPVVFSSKQWILLKNTVLAKLRKEAGEYKG